MKDTGGPGENHGAQQGHPGGGEETEGESMSEEPKHCPFSGAKEAVTPSASAGETSPSRPRSGGWTCSPTARNRSARMTRSRFFDSSTYFRQKRAKL